MNDHLFTAETGKADDSRKERNSKILGSAIFLGLSLLCAGTSIEMPHRVVDEAALRADFMKAAVAAQLQKNAIPSQAVDEILKSSEAEVSYSFNTSGKINLAEIRAGADARVARAKADRDAGSAQLVMIAGFLAAASAALGWSARREHKKLTGKTISPSSLR